MTARDRLAPIAANLQAGVTPEPVTVRTLLGWFSFERRGRHRVRSIRNALEAAGLITQPDFAGVYIDGAVTFALKPDTTRIEPASISIDASATLVPGTPQLSTTGSAEALPLLSGATSDPTYRVSRLGPANRPPLTVNPETPLPEAVTLMLLHDYSQLPVMQSQYTVKGAVSWRSIGKRLTLKTTGTKAKDFMEDVRVIASTDSIFTAIPQIVQHEFVLVRNEQNQITGILTTTDLSEQLRTLTEPFLLLDEIENHLRHLIDGRFTLEEAKAAQHKVEDEREIESVADLTFGEHIRLLNDAERWSRIALPLDRGVFIKQLDKVREIRNDVMHFDPEGVGEEELSTLRSFVLFLQGWQHLSTA